MWDFFMLTILTDVWQSIHSFRWEVIHWKKKNQVRMKRLGYLVHTTPTSEIERELKFEVIPNSCCCNLLFPQTKLPEKYKKPEPQRALRYKYMDFSRGWAPGGTRKALGSFSYAFPCMPSDDIYTLHNSLSNNLANFSKRSPWVLWVILTN